MSKIRFKFVCFRSKGAIVYTPDTSVQEVLHHVNYARFVQTLIRYNRYKLKHTVLMGAINALLLGMILKYNTPSHPRVRS